MSTDIDSIKRKLLIKYPTFGSVIANLEFQKSIDIATAGTDGKVLLNTYLEVKARIRGYGILQLIL